jgi:hypothetical protein
MAGAGYRIFVDQEVFFAEDLMAYLMQQVATVFDNAAQRNSSITNPTEGMLSYTRDDDTLRFYNGVVWLPVANAGTITGVTAGTGLSGGGSSGSVSLAIDPAQNIRTLSVGTGLTANSNVGSVTVNLNVNSKGDILAGTAANTVAVLPVGANSQKLAANSSTATGLTWVSDSVNTVINAKGDLLVGTSDDIVARVGVGTNNQILVADSAQTAGVRWINAGEVPVFIIVDSSVSRTLILSDAGKLLRMNGSNTTVTVPADGSVNFPIGTQITVMQGATGPVQFAAASGVTIQVTPGLKLRTQFSVATLIKTASNNWLLFGDLVV